MSNRPSTAIGATWPSPDINLGEMLSRANRADEAMRELRAALALDQKLVDDNPTVTDFRHDLAAVHNNLGDHLVRVGETERALAEHRSALDQSEADRRQSAAPICEIGTRGSWRRSARCYRTPGARPRHSTPLREAHGMGAETRRRQPDRTEISQHPGIRRGSSGRALPADLGQTAEAKAICERARRAARFGCPGYTRRRRVDATADALFELGHARRAEGHTSAAATEWRRCVSCASVPAHENKQSIGIVLLAPAPSGLGDVPGSGVSAEEKHALADCAVDLLAAAVAAGYRRGEVLRRDLTLNGAPIAFRLRRPHVRPVHAPGIYSPAAIPDERGRQPSCDGAYRYATKAVTGVKTQATRKQTATLASGQWRYSSAITSKSIVKPPWASW